MNEHNQEKKSSVAGNYNRYPIEFVSGTGSTLVDAAGKEYLDFMSGIAVTSFGHQHPLIKAAVIAQLNKVWHTSNLFEISLQKSVAEKLTAKTGLEKVFFCNSGTEANEAAIKYARKWGGERFEIITATGGFHGRTMGSLSATGQSKIQDGFSPLLPGFVYVPFNNSNAIRAAINSNTVAVLIEPIQGENGIMVPDDNYLAEVSLLCAEHNLLLIIDEVQTGIGRTGSFFAYQMSNIIPDMVTFAKGIANGLPLGGLICNAKVSQVMVPGTHGSTFGGNHVSLAAAEVVLDLLTDEKLAEIAGMGEYLMKELRLVQNEHIKDVRGKGLLIGVELAKEIEVKKIAELMLKEGVVCGTSGNNTLRLLPPFIISKTDRDHFIAVFKKIVN